MDAVRLERCGGAARVTGIDEHNNNASTSTFVRVSLLLRCDGRAVNRRYIHHHFNCGSGETELLRVRSYRRSHYFGGKRNGK